jgi:hypothetical protein
MNTTIKLSWFFISALFLVACGSDGGPTSKDLTSDSDQTSDVIAETDLSKPDAADVSTLPEILPQPGDPCDDDDPCTFGELIQDDDSCGGGDSYTCDDGRDCTEDLCDGLGNCAFMVTQGHCLANGICYSEGDAGDGCATCLPEEDVFALVPLAEGASCDDENACTIDDTCSESLCVGTTIDCDDENGCTSDSCDPTDGCQNNDINDQSCAALDACTESGFCVDGECEPGDVLVCDDENECTSDSCDPDEGCQFESLDGTKCSDGDICTGGDMCVEGECLSGEEQTDCNDGNECTLDLCHLVSGCYHELNDNPCCDDFGVNMCDDGNWCTTDSCDPETGECFYDFNDFVCNDANPCTGPDACLDGACGGPLLDCDDGNPCTEDSCNPDSGCIHTDLDGVSCDDGLDCSTGDSCVAGECIANLQDCLCQPEFFPTVNKINSLIIGGDGKPGSGLDIDLDPATCSPSGCSDGIDNSLSMLAGFANEPLVDALTGGSVILLVEHRGFVTDGTDYTASLYIAKLANDGCDHMTQSCDYLVQSDSFDEECNPVVFMDNAKTNGTSFSAGGPGYDFSIPMPLADNVVLDLKLYFAQVNAEVTIDNDIPVALEGVLGGAVSKVDMLAAIEAVPADQLPLDKAMIISLIDMMVENDIDTDGNGSYDAASIGLPFTAIAGTITGVEQ